MLTLKQWVFTRWCSHLYTACYMFILCPSWSCTVIPMYIILVDSLHHTKSWLTWVFSTYTATNKIKLCVTVIFNVHHINVHNNTETNLEIVHALWKGPKLSTIDQYEIHIHYKHSSTNILNYQLHYKTQTLFDTITRASYTNISAIPTTMNLKMNPLTASSTGTAKALKMVHMTPKSFCWILK